MDKHNRLPSDAVAQRLTECLSYVTSYVLARNVTVDGQTFDNVEDVRPSIENQLIAVYVGHLHVLGITDDVTVPSAHGRVSVSDEVEELPQLLSQVAVPKPLADTHVVSMLALVPLNHQDLFSRHPSFHRISSCLGLKLRQEVSLTSKKHKHNKHNDKKTNNIRLPPVSLTSAVLLRRL